MNRRALWGLPLLGCAACVNDTPMAPEEAGLPDTPSFTISDGAHGTGNPDFFFIPPMVPNPSGDADYTPAGFNPNLSPTVVICALDVANNAPESAVTPTTGCRSTQPAGFPVTFSGSQIAMSLSQQLYQVDWKIVTAPQTYYRIFVGVGTTQLGYADLKTANTGNTSQFVVKKDGSTLPIKFRIEQFALCTDPGTGPCSSGTIDRTTGGTVLFTDGGEIQGGITIPPQGSGGPVHVTIAFCASESPSVAVDLSIDNPVFGSCMSVTTDPAIEGDNGLDPNLPGTAFICGLDDATSGLPAGQHDLVSLHRFDGEITEALPHVGPTPCPEDVGLRDHGLTGLRRALASGRWEKVRAFALGLLAPEPLQAAMFLDVGGGGQTRFFSDFQFALPVKMVIDETTVVPGALVVLVTDLLGNPAANARVHFFTNAGSVAPGTVLSGADGLATSVWTPSGTGTVTATATGYGIASQMFDCDGPCEPIDGPRGDSGDGDSFFDPFQALQSQFNPNSDPIPDPLVPVQLETGQLTFTHFIGCEICSPAALLSRGKRPANTRH
ncbi:MAG TPA: Ig-like domain-containing protein [Gemmatimonadales bacterium]|nr:Ig-like domain-containing protein [Gemmatimonadales bacterium]